MKAKNRTAATLPPTLHIRRRDTHRLIPAKYSARDPLEDIAENAEQLIDLAALSNSTNEMPLAHGGVLPAISPHELVSGVRHAQVINAAFIYAHPLGSRFNSADRGAWYAAFLLSTAQAEVAFNRTVHLAEVGRYEDDVELDDYLADFDCDFHDIRRAKQYAACLDPSSYVASQTLAEKLLESGSRGIVYPSVRRARGTCVACFDAREVANVRRAGRLRFIWKGKPTPRIVRVDVTSEPPARD